MHDAVGGGHVCGFNHHVFATNTRPRTKSSSSVVPASVFNEVSPEDSVGVESTGDHVVGQNSSQHRLGLGLKQRLQGFSTQAGKGGIGWCEDRKRTITCQSIHQTGGLDRGDQGVEAFGADGDFEWRTYFEDRRARRR